MARLITLALALTTVFSSSESLPSAPHPETKVRQIEQFDGARDVNPESFAITPQAPVRWGVSLGCPGRLCILARPYLPDSRCRLSLAFLWSVEMPRLLELSGTLGIWRWRSGCPMGAFSTSP